MKRGGPEDFLTIQQYKSFFVEPSSGNWNTLHMRAFFFSILTSVFITAVNFAICYPLAYYMAQAGTIQKVRLLMLCLIVPYWVNEILRAFSLRLLLASKGLINQTLMGIGIIDTPIDFLGNNTGLYIGLSYAYLLIMVFPLYNAIESLDKNQIEAARDLGAPGGKSTGTLSSPMPSRASPPAAPWCSCCRPVRWQRPSSWAGQAPCGSPPSSMTSSSRLSTGRAVLLTPSSC